MVPRSALICAISLSRATGIWHDCRLLHPSSAMAEARLSRWYQLRRCARAKLRGTLPSSLLFQPHLSPLKLRPSSSSADRLPRSFSSPFPPSIRRPRWVHSLPSGRSLPSTPSTRGSLPKRDRLHPRRAAIPPRCPYRLERRAQPLAGLRMRRIQACGIPRSFMCTMSSLELRCR